MTNALAWFEIPVADLERAARFYGEILETPLEPGSSGEGYRMAVLPYEAGVGVGGALVEGSGHAPSAAGTLVYLSADLDAVLGRLERAGGKVLLGKTEIGTGSGFCAHFEDSEGNRVGLYSST